MKKILIFLYIVSGTMSGGITDTVVPNKVFSKDVDYQLVNQIVSELIQAQDHPLKMANIIESQCPEKFKKNQYQHVVFHEQKDFDDFFDHVLAFNHLLTAIQKNIEYNSSIEKKQQVLFTLRTAIMKNATRMQRIERRYIPFTHKYFGQSKEIDIPGRNARMEGRRCTAFSCEKVDKSNTTPIGPYRRVKSLWF